MQPSGKSEALIQEIFADFEVIDEKRGKMREAAVQFCRDMAAGKEPYWIAFLGSSGAGKTMLARRIFRFFARHLEGGRDHRSTETHRMLRKGGFLEWHNCMRLMIEENDFGWLRQSREDWLVGFDDIAAEHASHRELSASKLYDLFCCREKLWTVITANLKVDQIGEFIDTRVASRLMRHGAVYMNVNVQDYNLHKHLSRQKAA